MDLMPKETLAEEDQLIEIQEEIVEEGPVEVQAHEADSAEEVLAGQKVIFTEDNFFLNYTYVFIE